MPHQFADINGHRLRYSLEGEGPLAVFGHGLLGSIEQLDDHAPALERLRKRLRLLLYDARGHGQSTGPESTDHYTWATLGDDMAAFVSHAGEERAIASGASMGAATALWLAIERPERVSGLVLVMPPPLGRIPDRDPAELQAIQILDLLAAAVENFGLEKTVELAKMYPGFAPTPEEAEVRAGWLLTQNPLALRFAIRGLVAAPFHDPEAYRRITVPTLVLAHEGDGLHPARAARLLGETIPGARVKIASEPNYWRTHPDEFADEIESFLDSIE